MLLNLKKGKLKLKGAIQFAKKRVSNKDLGGNYEQREKRCFCKHRKDNH